MQRSEQHRILFGVCAALAQRVGIAALWARLAFLLLAMASGVGVLLYLLLALILPTERSARLGLFERMRFHLLEQRQRFAALARELLEPHLDEQRQARSAMALLGALLFLSGLFLLVWTLGLFSLLSVAQSLALLLLLGGIAVLAAAAR